MNKQDFILTELEAIGKDIEAIVRQGRDLLAMEEKHRQELEERHKKGGAVAIGGPARSYDPNKLIPELAYIETRLRAVKNYITESDTANPLRI